MLGMEMLIGNMLGIKPDEAKNAFENIGKAIHQGASDLAYIRARLDEIYPPEQNGKALNHDGKSGNSDGRIEL